MIQKNRTLKAGLLVASFILLKPTTQASIGNQETSFTDPNLSTTFLLEEIDRRDASKKSKSKVYGDEAKGIFCKARYVHAETGETVIMRITEVREDQATNCNCKSDSMFFGTHYFPAPEGYFYSSGCEVVYPGERRPAEPGKVTYYDFRSRTR